MQECNLERKDPFILNDPEGHYQRGFKRGMLDNLAALTSKHYQESGATEIKGRNCPNEMAIGICKHPSKCHGYTKSPIIAMNVLDPEAKIPGTYAANWPIGKKIGRTGRAGFYPVYLPLRWINRHLRAIAVNRQKM